MNVTEILEKWYDTNKRDLPWRSTESAYHIWLSEIILQQTRISQGLEYYNRFVERFPRVDDLAEATIDEVLKLWQGLGYYTRARNLHETAQLIVNEHGSHFPSSYKELIKLKGIGTYTAAAIASLAYREPVAVVDGNVYRVLSRLYGISIPIDTVAGKSVFTRIASEILNKEKPHIHNQALMEFGALACTPKNPQCNTCVLAKMCKAFLQGSVDLFPVKAGKGNVRIRYFNYLFIQHLGKTYLKKRDLKDIWNSLYEFPLIETPVPLQFNELISYPVWNEFFRGRNVPTGNHTRVYIHKLTHQTLHCYFYNIKVTGEPIQVNSDYIPVSLSHLNEFAVPRAIDRYLEDLKHEGLL